jgi:D-hexose-6-phosphate mutarotase
MNVDLPAGVTLGDGRGGLPRLTVATDLCTAELYLHGAHLCHWQPRSHPHPVLWMSRASRFEAGAPIRGGVPICFPWFGPNASAPAAPAHGVARIVEWTIDRVEAERDGTTVIVLSLAADAGTRAVAPHEFTLAYELRLGDALSMALTVANPAGALLAFEEALHTYFAVSDVRQVGVEGLAGATFVDKTDGGQRKTQDDAVITVRGETDRLYVNTPATITLADPGFGRRIRVVKSGSLSSVVWNPWVAKSRAMADFGDDEWPGMICIETANAVENAVTLPPGASHTMTAAVSLVGPSDSF